MKVETGKRKTVDDSKKFCRDVRKRKESAIEIVHKFTEIIDSENLLKFLPDEIEQVKKVVEDSIRGFEKLDPQLDTQTKFNDRFKGEVDNRETELVRLQSEISRLKHTVDAREERASAIDVLKKNVALLENDRGAVGSKIRALESEMPLLQHEISSMRDELGNSKEESDKLYSERNQLASELESLTNEINDLESSGGKKTALDELDEKIKQLKNDKISTASKNRRQESEIESLTRETSSSRDELENSKEETSNLDSEKVQLISDLESLTNEVNDLEGSGGKKSDLDELKKKILRLKKDKDTVGAKTRKQASEIEILKEETAFTRAKLENNKEETSNLDNEKPRLVAELESLIECSLICNSWTCCLSLVVLSLTLFLQFFSSDYRHFHMW